jgi:hypothetical protein
VGVHARDKPALPAVKAKAWVRTPIDAFVLAKLEAKGLAPSPDADRATFIRRATLDAWGLIPTPEEVKAFVNDKSPKAYDKLVDRLLASPHYGERQGRRWLDLTRYADSDGYNADGTRPNIWRYRDYVIASFNQDKPFDRFVKEQIAGDELWPDRNEALIATGFLRNFPDEINARDLNLKKQEVANDLTDTVSSVFLGTTLGCAQCHDHKFDKISQKEYYQFQAFFVNASWNDDVKAVEGPARAEYSSSRRSGKRRPRTSARSRTRCSSPSSRSWRATACPASCPTRARPSPSPRPSATPTTAGSTTATCGRCRAARATRSRNAQAQGQGRLREVRGARRAAEGLRRDQAEGSGQHLDDERARPRRRAAHLRAVQGHLRPQARRGAAGLPVAADQRQAADRADGDVVGPPHRGRQLDHVARQPADRARVRQPPVGAGVRQRHRRIGERLRQDGHQAHEPELLDYLSAEFVQDGWSVKKLQREILLSHTYRQASAPRSDAEKVDPTNKLLWAFPRQRLEAEEIRDSLLQASGLLEDKLGGPSVFPPLPAGTQAPNRNFWITSDNPHDVNRRSVYVFIRRNLPYPLLDTFDWANPQIVHNKRDVTTTAPQALALINSDLVYSWSKSLAGRVIKDVPKGGDAARIDRVYEILYSRKPDAFEKASCSAFLNSQQAVRPGSSPRARRSTCRTATASRRRSSRRSRSSTRSPTAARRIASRKPRSSSSSTSRSRRRRSGRPRRIRTTTRSRSPPRPPPPTPPPTRRRRPTTAPGADDGTKNDPEAAHAAAFVDLVHALSNANDFLYRF